MSIDKLGQKQAGKTPKAKCTPQQMVKVLRRNMEISGDDIQPEHELILAVIGCAITDLTHKTHRRSALSFFAGELFCKYCGLIGLNPEATRELLLTGGFITPADILEEVKTKAKYMLTTATTEEELFDAIHDIQESVGTKQPPQKERKMISPAHQTPEELIQTVRTMMHPTELEQALSDALTDALDKLALVEEPSVGE